MNTVGTIKFGNKVLNVYGSLDEPLFRASDVADMLDRRAENTEGMLRMCEDDEVLRLPTTVAGHTQVVYFVTEIGLYNLLSQSSKEIARGWRRIVSNELVELRRSRNKDVVEQFEDWDHQLDDIYFDEETGMLMQSVTVPGGDVIQVPYNGGNSNG